jgi:hypothetical protein
MALFTTLSESGVAASHCHRTAPYQHTPCSATSDNSLNPHPPGTVLQGVKIPRPLELSPKYSAFETAVIPAKLD